MRLKKVIALILVISFLCEQAGFAQMLPAYYSAPNNFSPDKFRPVHLRSLGYDKTQDNFRLLLDKGDLKNHKKGDLESTTKDLFNYFLVGVTLPNESFWVNLRPDSENYIIDDDLGKTDAGKILLEADLQLKKDTAQYTSPKTPAGRIYCDKLYKKAVELLGTEELSIPALTRPWIVPGEIIIYETKDSAYIYKAALKVMLEQDYLSREMIAGFTGKDSAAYNFDDPRIKTLNEYSSQLIRELILPQLTKAINTSKKYAPLRQVYYSLILAQWFKQRFHGKKGQYARLIDRRDLSGLTSRSPWSKETYFKKYQKSFKNGEYTVEQAINTPDGPAIISYFSGGFIGALPEWKPPVSGMPGFASKGPTSVIALSGEGKYFPQGQVNRPIAAVASNSRSEEDIPEIKVTITGEPAAGMPEETKGATAARIEEAEADISSPLKAPVSSAAHAERNQQLAERIRQGRVYRVERAGKEPSIQAEWHTDQQEYSELRMAQASAMQEALKYKIARVSDPEFLRSVLSGNSETSRYLREYSLEEQDSLIRAASRVPILLVSNAYLLHDYGTFAHARRGVSGLEAAIWMGEKSLLSLSAEQAALMLLEEAQHIVNPLWKHGAEGAQSETIVHSQRMYEELAALASANGEHPGSRFCETDMAVPKHAVYAVQQDETFDDIVIKELAKKRGISVDDLEADFERTVIMAEERVRYSGFIESGEDATAQKMHDVFDRLITVYRAQTKNAPGSFHVVDANDINAFVFRKRTDVYFYKGLYEALHDISKRMNAPLTEDMIAFIIAHELSHALQNSSHQGLDVRDLSGTEYQYIIQMMKNGEYDADRKALELMDEAGYSVFGAIDAITFLEFITQSSQAENVLSSHPYVSLRKHRLSQIIFEQKFNVFTNAKAPRPAMAGSGRMKSRDADFRYLIDKNEADLLAMANKAHTVDALDELTGIFIIRKRMNALKALMNEDYLKTSFLRHVYMQAVLRLVMGGSYSVFSDGDMRKAAAIYDFGIAPSAKGGFLEVPIKEFEIVKFNIDNFNESLSKTNSESIVAAGKLFNEIFPVVKKIVDRLDYQDFDGFLLSPEEVKDLVSLSGLGKDAGTVSSGHGGKNNIRELIDKAVNDPRRLISAFLYSQYLGQKPSVEHGVSRGAVNIRGKLVRKNNSVYLENPAYRSVQSAEERKKIQDIVLLHYALDRSGYIILKKGIQSSFPGINVPVTASPEITEEVFSKYVELFSEKYPKPVAIRLAEKRIENFENFSVLKNGPETSLILNSPDTVRGFIQGVEEVRKSGSGSAKVKEFIDSHPLIVFIRATIREFPDLKWIGVVREFEGTINKLAESGVYGSIEDDLLRLFDHVSHIYALQARRSTKASSLFFFETGLDYYPRDKQKNIDSLKSLLTLPGWAISEYLNESHSFSYLVMYAIEAGMPLESIFEIMRSRFSYADRKKIFNDTFFVHNLGSLNTFFKTALHNDPWEIILWFHGMFSRTDSLEFIEKYFKLCFERKQKLTERESQAEEYEKLAVALFEYVCNQTSKNYQVRPESAAQYLELMNRRIEASGNKENAGYVRQAVFDALLVLSRAAKLEINISCPDEASLDGAADFKSQKTNIITGFQADDTSRQYESMFALHNFGWNEKNPSGQSVFVTYLSEMTIEQLRQMLKQRRSYMRSLPKVEYREEYFSPYDSDDFFAHLVTVIIIKKILNPEWGKNKKPVERLDELIKITVSFVKDKNKAKILVKKGDVGLKIDGNEFNAVPYTEITNYLVGTAVPSSRFDPLWEEYVTVNKLQGEFPEMASLFQNPNVSRKHIDDPQGFLKRISGGKTTSYRQIAQKFYKDSSAYSRLFNEYCKSRGNGYVYGAYKSLEERLAWVEKALPYKSIIKDNIFDLWEAHIFPEIIADLSIQNLMKSQKNWGDNIWGLLGEFDDDVGRLKRLNDAINLSPERIYQILDFYETIMPLALSPQKISRYGATAYVLWEKLPENSGLGLPEKIEALTKFMPEPGILRDDLLMGIAGKHSGHLEDVPLICEKLYLNNLLSPDRNLRTEEFMSETVLHLFGPARIEDRRDILLWMVGVRDKPYFVARVEKEYRIDFTTLPGDVKLLPSFMRERLIEGFMLGDNGVLDPQGESDRAVMADFLERLFLNIFPAGTKGLTEEERILLSRSFIIVMKSYPPYRRVQIIKALAALCARPDFAGTSTGERLKVLLGVLGPVGIKTAQYLSENEVLVPDDNMRTSLGTLRSHAPEITKISVFSVLENEVPSAEILVREVGTAVGVASMKQVNRGKWLDIEALAGLVAAKASSAEAGEIRKKMEAYHARKIALSEFVAFMVEKSGRYEIDLNDASVPVVFKVRRPSIETTLDIDFAALDEVARELEGVTLKGEGLNLSDLVQTVKSWIILEMFFLQEVKFHERLSELDYTWAGEFARKAGVTIDNPRIMYATDSLIVEEEMQGVPVSSLAQKQRPAAVDDVVNAGYARADAEEVLKRLAGFGPRQGRIILDLKKAGFPENSLEGLSGKMLAYDYSNLRLLLRQILLHQMFIDGVFHADLHQGNVLVTPDGRLVMIDRGNVGELNKEQIEGAKILLQGLLLREKELIKHGVDLIFLQAGYPEGVAPTGSRITLEDIQEVLDKGDELKMTMNMISVRAVQGAKNTPGGRDFSTFLKAFTQAMYLFPTDLSNGRETLQAIAGYIGMSEEDALRAATEQAKYFVVKNVENQAADGWGVEAGEQETDIARITRKIFYEKTERYFLHSMWRPVVFGIMAIPLQKGVSRSLFMKINMMSLVKTHGRKFIEENIGAFMEKQDLEIGEAVRDIISVQSAERFIVDYTKNSVRERFLGRLWGALAVFMVKAVLVPARPFIRVYVEAVREWLGTTGKQYITKSFPPMTVRQAIDLLAQIFPEEFGGIQKSFYEGKTNSVRGIRTDGGENNRVVVQESGRPRAELSQGLEKDLGGIDFRALPIAGRFTAVTVPQLRAADVVRLSNINPDLEWAEIGNMIKAGAIPSSARIKEYLLACCQRQCLGGKMADLLGCIADIMRMEEENALDSDAELISILVSIESGKLENELQQALNQMIILP